MSGLVGILNLDGAPVDRVLLERMTRFLAFRGPDAQEVLCAGPLGLGHAMLRATHEAATEKQPGTLDGRLYIVADARIDARADLLRELQEKAGHAASLSLANPDSDLILHAYDTWGEACVDHLLGDFSFAIWDAPKRRLFCARDHFGVKLLYYSRVGSSFVFSNTLKCLRQHPAVSGRLNDLAIADFLLFDMNQDPATTSFTDIQRLPPAYLLNVAQSSVTTRRYWNLAAPTPVHFSRDEEYVERFRELLDAAVADRLRADSASVRMSGGLDSSTVAASAQRVFTRNGAAVGLSAYTEVFQTLIPHEERHYAGLVADFLKIPIHFLDGDGYQLFDRGYDTGISLPEPTHAVLMRSTQDQLRQIAGQSRVLLTGDGADPDYPGRISVHFRQLIAQRRFGQLLGDAARYFAAEGRLSRLYIRTRWRLITRALSKNVSSYPGWLDVDLEKRLCLRNRWESLSQPQPIKSAVRLEAYQPMVDATWPNMFEEFDAGLTQVPVECRYPFFDVRLTSFLLTLPRLPWCCDKHLLRESGRGVLPEAVRLRRKSPLQADPLIAILQRPESTWVDYFDPVPELEHWVARDRIPAVRGETDSWTAWIHLRPLSLNFWLRDLSR